MTMMQASGPRKRIYMDHAAACPVDDRVLQAMMPFFSERFGNPSSLHGAGREPRRALEEARQKVAGLVNAKRKEEIVFTSGATEASNIGIKGVAMRMRSEGNHVVTSAIEHISILNIMKYLEKNGFEVTYIRPTRDGVVDVGDLERAIRKETVLVSIMYANNEIGTLQPIDEIGKLLEQKDVCFHVDAVAVEGKMPIDVQKSGIDLLTLSSNDLYGPKGAGALYLRDGTRIEAVAQGGGQERGLRSGSEDIPAIVGFGAAAEIAKSEMGSEAPRLAGLRDRLIKGVLDRTDEAFLNGHPTRRLPNNANFRFRYVEGESMLLTLDMRGISVASSSPCTSKSLLPSHVLLACEVPTEEAQSAVQFTLGRSNTSEEVDYVVQTLPDIIKRLRAMSPFSPKNIEEMRSTAGHREHENAAE